MKAKLFVLSVILIGCSSPPPVTDEVTARAALKTSLESWKSGQSISSLQDHQPPVFVIEDRWLAGAKLKTFSISESSQVVGSSIRFTVELKFPRATENACYSVTTDPALTVARVE